MEPRARRALAIMSASILTIGIAGILYTHPTFPTGQKSQSARIGTAASTAYQVAADDFVNASTGWVVAEFASGDYSILHTRNAGRSWAQQLSVAGAGNAVYLRFFDPSNGVFGVLGVHAMLFRTSDGGGSWTAAQTVGGSASVLSWSFADPAHGWMLVGAAHPTQSVLYRTTDGGGTWVELGAPLRTPEQSFRVAFLNPATGWLESVSAGPYAYRSNDSGRTWERVALPAPPQGWPHAAQFFVAPQPTHQNGVVVTVAMFAAVKGRSGTGATVVGYPPLTLRTFDGGVPVVYSYKTFNDQLTSGTGPGRPHEVGQFTAPNQIELGSLDGGRSWTTIAAPSPAGAIGFADAWDWWWIGIGSWATSADGGVTWSQPRSLGVPAPAPGSLQVLDVAHAWYAADTGSWPAMVATDDRGKEWRLMLLPAISDNPG